MRSLLRLCATFVVIGIFFTACSSREAHRPDRVSVEFWHSMGRRHSTVLNEIIADFEQANPDVRINAVYQGSYNSLLTNLTASSTAETNPVMSQMYESWTTRLINHDMLISVDEMNEKYGGLSQESIRDIPEVFVRDNTWNDRLFTLPFNKSAYVLYFNRDAMKEIGLVDENGRGRAPVTWEELRNASMKLKIERDGSVKRYGFGIRPFIEGYTTFLFRAGGRYLNEGGDKVLFTDDVGVETMKYLVSLINEDESGYVEPDYLSTAFGTGRIAMYVGTIASMPYNARAVSDKFDWDTAPIPYPDGKKEEARTLFQGTNVGVFGNHSEEKIEAAWRFLKFLTSTESAATWSVGTGYLPIRYSVLETEKMQSYLKDNPRYRTPVSLLDNGTFEPRIPIWEPMRKVITDHFEAALNGRRTPEETINIMARKCRKIIETF